MYVSRVGPSLAITGLAIPFGWYFVIAAVLVVLGFVLVRLAVRRGKNRLEQRARLG